MDEDKIMETLVRLDAKLDQHANEELHELQAIEKRKGPLEKHIQTIFVGVITTAIVSMAGFVYNISKDVSVLGTKLENLTVLFQKLETRMDSMQNSYVNRGEFIDLERRVRGVEQGKR